MALAAKKQYMPPLKFKNSAPTSTTFKKETPEEEATETPEMQAGEENSMLDLLKKILGARTLEESKALAQEAIDAHGQMDTESEAE